MVMLLTNSRSANPDSTGGGGGGTGGGTGVSPTDARSLNELIGTMYGGYPDPYQGGALVGYKTNWNGSPGTLSPYGAHDGGRLHGYNSGEVDWSDGAVNYLDPVTGSGWAVPGLAGRPFLNAWNHGWLLSTENRFYLEWTDPLMFIKRGTTWTQVPWPSTASDFWASWIRNNVPTAGNHFNFQSTPIVSSTGTTSGGTHYNGVDFQSVTYADTQFLHSAPNHWFPRYDTRTLDNNSSGPLVASTAISIQCYMRLRAKAGVDPTTINVIGGFAGDTFAGASDSLGNPAIWFPRLKRMPVDGSWRLVGSSQQSLSDMIANPPPLVAYPL